MYSAVWSISRCTTNRRIEATCSRIELAKTGSEPPLHAACVHLSMHKDMFTHSLDSAASERGAIASFAFGPPPTLSTARLPVRITRKVPP